MGDCQRCDGLLVQDDFLDMTTGERTSALYCLNCGHRVEAVLNTNAIKGADPAYKGPRKTPTHRTLFT